MMDQEKYFTPSTHQIQQGVSSNQNDPVGTNASQSKAPSDPRQFSSHIGNYKQPRIQIPTMPDPSPILNQRMPAPAYNNFYGNQNAFPQGSYQQQDYQMMQPPMSHNHRYSRGYDPLFRPVRFDTFGNCMNQYHPMFHQQQAQRQVVQNVPEKELTKFLHPDADVIPAKPNEHSENTEEDDLKKKKQQQFFDAVKNRVKGNTLADTSSVLPISTTQSDEVFESSPADSGIEIDQTFDATDECLSAIEGPNEFEYSLDFLNTVFEVVKCYKEPLPSDLSELIKAKRLDLASESFHQSLNKSKRGGMSGGLKFDRPSALGAILNYHKKDVQGGRRDSNKVHDNKFVDRSPFKHKNSVSSPASPVNLHKAENAWKPKRNDESKLAEDDQKHEAARKKIRSILNKLTPTSFDTLRQEFFEINVDQNEHYRQLAIDLIFEKAVEEPKFCAMYTKLCKEQAERGHRKADSFYYTLLQKVQKSFEGKSTFGSKINELEASLATETDEAKKEDLNDRLEIFKKKEKSYILGNIKFISHLYTVGFVADKVISFCLCKLKEMFEETKDEVFVQYGIEMLEMISKIFFSQEKKKKREGTDNSQKNVDMFIRWISTDDAKNSVSTKVGVMIMNFEDFVEAGYVKHNADAGPKTIQQVHEDLQKEKDETRAKQLEYQARQKQQQRHSAAGRNLFNQAKGKTIGRQFQVGVKNSSERKGVSNIINLKNVERKG